MFVTESDVKKASISLVELTSRALELQNTVSERAHELNAKIDLLTTLIPNEVLIERISVIVSNKQITSNGKIELKNSVSLGMTGSMAVFSGAGVTVARVVMACIQAGKEGLSGAAIITRALSILGGGSIAAGGGGMVGGLTSLGYGFLGVGLVVVGVGVGINLYRNSTNFDELQTAQNTMVCFITELSSQLERLKIWEERKLNPLYELTIRNLKNA